MVLSSMEKRVIETLSRIEGGYMPVNWFKRGRATETWARSAEVTPDRLEVHEWVGVGDLSTHELLRFLSPSERRWYWRSRQLGNFRRRKRRAATTGSSTRPTSALLSLHRGADRWF